MDLKLLLVSLELPDDGRQEGLVNELSEVERESRLAEESSEALRPSVALHVDVAQRIELERQPKPRLHGREHRLVGAHRVKAFELTTELPELLGSQICGVLCSPGRDGNLYLGVYPVAVPIVGRVRELPAENSDGNVVTVRLAGWLRPDPEAIRDTNATARGAGVSEI